MSFKIKSSKANGLLKSFKRKDNQNMETKKNSKVSKSVKTAVLIGLVCVMSVSCLAGCGNAKKTQSNQPPSTQTQQADQGKNGKTQTGSKPAMQQKTNTPEAGSAVKNGGTQNPAAVQSSKPVAKSDAKPVVGSASSNASKTGSSDKKTAGMIKSESKKDASGKKADAIKAADKTAKTQSKAVSGKK